MYTSLISTFFLASLAVATPLQKRQSVSSDISPCSSAADISSSSFPIVSTGIDPASVVNGVNIDGFGGFGSLTGFDSFCGIDNFDCLNNNQIFSGDSLSCSSIDINVVQQQLAILGEVIKQIVLTEICEVEAQTLAFQQFSSGLFDFQNSLFRNSNLEVGFDSNIADLIEELFLDGLLNTNDFGFLGSDVGQNSVFVNSNWNDISSPASVQSAFGLAQQAIGQSFLANPARNRTGLVQTQ